MHTSKRWRPPLKPANRAKPPAPATAGLFYDANNDKDFTFIKTAKNIIFYILKAQVLLIYYFFLTRLDVIRSMLEQMQLKMCIVLTLCTNAKQHSVDSKKNTNFEGLHTCMYEIEGSASRSTKNLALYVHLKQLCCTLKRNLKESTQRNAQAFSHKAGLL